MRNNRVALSVLLFLPSFRNRKAEAAIATVEDLSSSSPDKRRHACTSLSFVPIEEERSTHGASQREPNLLAGSLRLLGFFDQYFLGPARPGFLGSFLHGYRVAGGISSHLAPLDGLVHLLLGAGGGIVGVHNDRFARSLPSGGEPGFLRRRRRRRLLVEVAQDGGKTLVIVAVFPKQREFLRRGCFGSVRMKFLLDTALIVIDDDPNAFFDRCDIAGIRDPREPLVVKGVDGNRFVDVSAISVDPVRWHLLLVRGS
mmetsp:Transcript_20619/g.48635  ORF Transcript_20619/g.48635 Transcript_20619/m.48635 type:complete len:256 (-) Transcript_20619:448-1215(-)